MPFLKSIAVPTAIVGAVCGILAAAAPADASIPVSRARASQFCAERGERLAWIDNTGHSFSCAANGRRRLYSASQVNSADQFGIRFR